jgi:hypothetical protein
MRNLWAGLGRCLYCMIFASIASFALVAGNVSAQTSESSTKGERIQSIKKTGDVKWGELNWDKRCEGLLEFIKSSASYELEKWTIGNPECSIEGNNDGNIMWSLDSTWRIGTKSIVLRHVVEMSADQKTMVKWCVVKGAKFGCAKVWQNSFQEGNLYSSSKDAQSAFVALSKISTGFLAVAMKMDEWVGKTANQESIFDLDYADWVKAWVNAPRTLPATAGSVSASYQVSALSNTSGTVKIIGPVPPSIVKCLGCETNTCTGTTITFSFSGLTLVWERGLSDVQRKRTGLKEGRAAWIMATPVPFVDGVGKWPLLCNTNRFNIKKF